MVLAVAFAALSGYREAWDRSDRVFQGMFDEARHHILVRDALESAYGYYVTSKGDPYSDRYFPLFEGTGNRMVFVTLSSVFREGSPAVVRLSLEQNAKEKYDLLYEEADLSNTYIKYATEDIQYQNQLTLHTDLEDAAFRYYGVYDTEFDPQKQELELLRKWTDRYVSQETTWFPDIIQILTDAGRPGEGRWTFQIHSSSDYKRGMFNLPFQK